MPQPSEARRQYWPCSLVHVCTHALSLALSPVNHSQLLVPASSSLCNRAYSAFLPLCYAALWQGMSCSWLASCVSQDAHVYVSYFPMGRGYLAGGWELARANWEDNNDFGILVLQKNESRF